MIGYKSAALATLLPWISADYGSSSAFSPSEPESATAESAENSPVQLDESQNIFNPSNWTVHDAWKLTQDVTSVRSKKHEEGDFFRTVTNPNAFDRVQDGLILRNYADSMLEAFLTEEATIAGPTVSDLLVHGCWCAKLIPNPFMAYLGGAEPVDILDEICRNWIRMRNCNDRLDGGSCNIDGSSSQQKLINGEYTLTIDPDNVGNSECKGNNADQCSDDTCEIDLYFMKQIRDYLVSSEGQDWVINGLTEVTGAGTCAASPDNNVVRVCSGDIPNLVPLQSAEAVFEKAAEQYLDDGWSTTGNADTPVVYKLFNTYQNWYSARDYCPTIADGASLAAVYDADEAVLVHALGAGASAWLGGNDIASERNWKWVVGKNGVEDTVSYTRWWYGEPNNVGYGGEDCMEKYTNGYWNDIPCTNSKIVICQIRSF